MNTKIKIGLGIVVVVALVVGGVYLSDNGGFKGSLGDINKTPTKQASQPSVKFAPTQTNPSPSPFGQARQAGPAASSRQAGRAEPAQNAAQPSAAQPNVATPEPAAVNNIRRNAADCYDAQERTYRVKTMADNGAFTAQQEFYDEAYFIYLAETSCPVVILDDPYSQLVRDFNNQPASANYCNEAVGRLSELNRSGNTTTGDRMRFYIREKLIYGCRNWPDNFGDLQPYYDYINSLLSPPQAVNNVPNAPRSN